MTEPESLQSVFDRAFAGISQAREAFTPQLTPREVGTITSVATGIAKVSGLPGVGFEELVKFPGDVLGIAFNVDEDEIGVVLLGEYWHLHAGDEVERTGRVMDVAVGDGLLGRVIDPLGRPLDGNGPVASSERLPIERPAPPIMDRAPVTVPLQTGLKVIDALIPIGRGQRELILGDRQTGKTAIAIDTILNQRGQNVLCVYCAIGQRASAVAKAVANLAGKGRDGLHRRRRDRGQRPAGPRLHRSLRRDQHRGAFHGSGPRRADRLRRPHPSRPRLSRALPPAAPSARPRSLSRRHLLHPLAAARTRDASAQGTRRRLAHRAAHHRDRSAGHFRLHSDQPDFHHGRADLSLAVAVRIGRAARGRCRQIRFARRRQGATRGLPRGGGRPQARLRAVRGTRDLCPVRRPPG